LKKTCYNNASPIFLLPKTVILKNKRKRLQINNYQKKSNTTLQMAYSLLFPFVYPCQTYGTQGLAGSHRCGAV